MSTYFSTLYLIINKKKTFITQVTKLSAPFRWIKSEECILFIFKQLTKNTPYWDIFLFYADLLDTLKSWFLKCPFTFNILVEYPIITDFNHLFP